MTCEVCAGEGWVCEEHRDQPWQHAGCGGAGGACVCNPERAVRWRLIYAEAESDEQPVLH